MSFSFSDDIKIKSVADYASGTADIETTIIDLAGFDSVCIVVHCATIAAGAVTDIFIESGTDDTVSDAAALAGTSITIADDDDNEIKYIDLHQVAERYIRMTINKDAANVWAGSAIAYLYNSRVKRPITQVAGEAEGERHAAPVEGAK